MKKLTHMCLKIGDFFSSIIDSVTDILQVKCVSYFKKKYLLNHLFSGIGIINQFGNFHYWRCLFGVEMVTLFSRHLASCGAEKSAKISLVANDSSLDSLPFSSSGSVLASIPKYLAWIWKAKLEHWKLSNHSGLCWVADSIHTSSLACYLRSIYRWHLDSSQHHRLGRQHLYVPISWSSFDRLQFHRHHSSKNRLGKVWNLASKLANAGDKHLLSFGINHH